MQLQDKDVTVVMSCQANILSMQMILLILIMQQQNNGHKSTAKNTPLAKNKENP